jgi:cysteine-rich repeat protein
MTRLLLARGLVVALGLFFAVPALSIPSTIRAQGSLLAVGGVPVADGPYILNFGIYDSAQGGQALWSEGPLQVAVTGGVFDVALGTLSPLDANTLPTGDQLWLGVAVGLDPELPRQPLASVPFATRASVATVATALQCSGCVTLAQIDPAVFGSFVQKGSLADVAVTGKYADLSGAPIVPNVGEACGSGLVMAGIKADGTYDCVPGSPEIKADTLPKDGLDEISNGLLANEFNEVIASANTPVAIADNNPVGISDVIDVPDLGTAESVSVSVELTNSDTSKLKVTLIDPNQAEYVLWDNGQQQQGINSTWPDPSPLLQGDLSTWVGGNPKGKWYLQIKDTGFLNNGDDGAIVSWSVNVKVFSSQKVGLGGALILKNLAQPPFPCTPLVSGAVYFDTAISAMRLCADGAWRTLIDSCGNGSVDAGEQCDDGNKTDGDGCSSACKYVCGDGVLVPGEQCDDGNLIDGDGCSSTCTTTCGDGFVAGSEQCDDGNLVDGDGCKSDCTSETTYALAKHSSGSKKLAFVLVPAGTTLSTPEAYKAACEANGFDVNKNSNSNSNYKNPPWGYDPSKYYCSDHCCFLGSGNNEWSKVSQFQNFGLPTGKHLRVFDRGCGAYSGGYEPGLNTTDSLLISGGGSATYTQNHFGGQHDYGKSKSLTFSVEGVIVCQEK